MISGCAFFVHSLCAIVIQPEIPVYHRNHLWSEVCDLESSGRISHIPFLHTPFITFYSPSLCCLFTPHSCVCFTTGIASASLFEFEINSSCLQLLFFKNILLLNCFSCASAFYVHSCVPKVLRCLLCCTPLCGYHLHFQPSGTD